MAATDQKPAESSAEGATEDDKEQRKPYVVVLMSAEMKAKLQEWAKANGTNPTALGRKLFAECIGYDISQEPQPTATRQKYTNDAEREAAKKRNSLKSSLLRKALFHVHQAQLKNLKDRLAVANRVVLTLSENPPYETLAKLDTELEEVIKTGK